MKKTLLLLLVLTSQFSEAGWITSFDQAQKMALSTNKLMIVDFWATWCGPCKKMDMESWNNSEVNLILQDYIQVKIDIDLEKELATKYGISSIPNMFIMDGNGKVVYNFSGFHDANGLKRELNKFALNVEYLSSDLQNYYKQKSYNSSLRVSQKYFDYSLLVDKDIKYYIVNTADEYLSEAKKNLSKSDEAYTEKKQKLELLSLYKFAFNSSFSKLEKKISEFNESEINENNIEIYYFLKYLACKGMNRDRQLPELQQKINTIEGFDFFIQKADLIITKSS